MKNRFFTIHRENLLEFAGRVRSRLSNSFYERLEELMSELVFESLKQVHRKRKKVKGSHIDKAFFLIGKKMKPYVMAREPSKEETKITGDEIFEWYEFLENKIKNIKNKNMEEVRDEIEFLIIDFEDLKKELIKFTNQFKKTKWRGTKKKIVRPQRNMGGYKKNKPVGNIP